MITHGDSSTHSARRQPARALAHARPGTAAQSPTLRDAKGPPPRPQPPLISAPGSRERRRVAAGARAAHWLGMYGAPPPPRFRGHRGRRRFRERGWAGGCPCNLGHLKGTFMLSVPRSPRNTVSPRHVGRVFIAQAALGRVEGLKPGQTPGGCRQRSVLEPPACTGRSQAQGFRAVSSFLHLKAPPTRTHCLDMGFLRAVRSRENEWQSSQIDTVVTRCCDCLTESDKLLPLTSFHSIVRSIIHSAVTY